MTTTALSEAPWTDEEVASLNGYQACGYMHEFTSVDGSVLIATRDGWVVREGGPVVQTWAHSFMVDGSWRKHPMYKGG